jgi:hypothetical protein
MQRIAAKRLSTLNRLWVYLYNYMILLVFLCNPGHIHGPTKTLPYIVNIESRGGRPPGIR